MKEKQWNFNLKVSALQKEEEPEAKQQRFPLNFLIFSSPPVASMHGLYKDLNGWDHPNISRSQEPDL